VPSVHVHANCTRALRRSQSFRNVVPSHPQTGVEGSPSQLSSGSTQIPPTERRHAGSVQRYGMSQKRSPRQVSPISGRQRHFLPTGQLRPSPP
jgi:hypothetical protein